MNRGTREVKPGSADVPLSEGGRVRLGASGGRPERRPPIVGTMMDSPVGPRAVINNREVDYFGGTSYYSLHANPRVIEAARAAIGKYGTGPGNTISTPPLRDAVRGIAAFFDTEDARVVASGYLADMMLVQTLRDDYDTAFVDDRSHYSVFDGIRATGKPVVAFGHLEPDDLRAKLKEHLRPRHVPLVLTDGVFPVTGAIAPLAGYAAVLSRYEGALLCIDDAHGVGVLGEGGRGTFEHWRLRGSNQYLAATLSKAFGGLGGFVPGSSAFTGKIDRSERIPEGASPPSTGAAAAAAMGVKILSECPEMRVRLRKNIAHLRRGLATLGIETGDTPVPIVCIEGRSGMDLKKLHTGLQEADIIVSHIPPRGYSDAPSVETLRIAVFSTHTEDQLDRLIDALGRRL